MASLVVCDEGRKSLKKEEEEEKKTFLTVEIKLRACARACVSGSHAEKMNNGEEGTE